MRPGDRNCGAAGRSIGGRRCCGDDRVLPALAQETVKLELWSRQDPSGPLRPGNVVKAAERLNTELEAEGSDKRVEVVVRESPAKGFDDDALQLLKVFGIGEGPDMFIAAHEWVCAFQADGFVLKLDDYIAKYPEHFGTIFPSLWESTKCPDGDLRGSRRTPRRACSSTTRSSCARPATTTPSSRRCRSARSTAT